MTKTISRSLLNRNIHSVHRIKVERVSDRGVSSETRWAGELTPRKLVQFLFYLHDRRGFVPRRKSTAYLADAKKVLAFNEETVREAMLKAAEVTKYPWGFGLVLKIIEEGQIETGDPFKSGNDCVWESGAYD